MSSGSRSLWAVAATAIALVWAAAPAVAQQVTVAPGGAAEQTLDLAALAAERDVVAKPYVVLDAAGAEMTLTVTGVSLDALLRKARVDPFDFDRLEVVDAAGGTLTLTRKELTSPGAFEDGPPVLYADDRGTHLLRPRTEDAAAAVATVAPGGALRLSLYERAKLKVTVKASTKRTDPRKPVIFTATVTGAPAGAALTYSWQFDDRGSGSGARVTHRFAKSGSYDVVVGVTTPDDPRGADAIVRVQVGEPKEGGPNRQGGGTNRDADAPDSGAGVGAQGPGGGPQAPSAPAPSIPAPAAPPPAVPAPAPPAADLEPVEGTLLADAGTELSTPHAEAIVAARTGNPDPDHGGLPSVPPAVWGLLAAIGLLALGAGFELRHGPARERT